MGNRLKRANQRLGINGLFAVAALSIVIFWRYVPETFDLTKSVFVLTSTPLVLATISLRNPAGWMRGKDWWAVAILFWLLLALLLSAFRNPSDQLAWIGQEHRYTGVLFWFVCLLGAVMVYRSSRPDSLLAFSKWVSIAAVPFLIYSFVQMTDSDPFRWGISSFNSRYVFSSQGNPNFASWTCALIFACGYLLANKQDSARWRALGLSTAICSMSVAVATVSIQGVAGIAVFLTCILGFRGLLILTGKSRSFEVRDLVYVAVFASGYVLSSNATWLLLSSVLGFVILYLVRDLSIEVSKFRLAAGSASLMAVGTGLLLVSHERVFDWMDQQFGERKAFYSAALGMFRDSPFLGHGFDRYGRMFTRYRPDWHAESLQNSISGSAHSLWLGLLVSGGLFLLLPVLLIFFGAVARSWRRAVTLSGDGDSVVLVALVVMLGILWIVSVEQVSVIFISLLVFGLAMGLERPDVRRVGSSVSRVVSAAGLALALVLAVFSVRWIEGNRAQSDAYRELYGTGNIQRGLELLDKAVRWGPHPSEVRAIRANVFSQLELKNAALSEANWVVEEYEYSGMGALESAKILLKYGEYQRAEEILVKAIENNDNNPLLVERANEALSAIRQP